MKRKYRIRLVVTIFVVLFGLAIPASQHFSVPQPIDKTTSSTKESQSAVKKLATLAVKGRAPKTGYTREQFGNGWGEENGCDTRNIILARDLDEITTNSRCQVTSGVLHDPYTSKTIHFVRGPSTSADIQIDHVVALSNAWQTGAQLFSHTKRVSLANDPLELLAVDGPANEQKSDGDAATWLPSNKLFRCQYVSRQIDVKVKYGLWVTSPEKSAIERVLDSC